nr:glycine/betaine ABC transporter [Chloroflexota bacterium]
PTSAPAAAKPSGPKPRVAIGSKNFTEQLIVGNIVAALLEDAGYPVDRKLNLGGTAVVHQALVNGDVDAYVEYTGTGLIALLRLPPDTDPRNVYNTVKREYEAQFKSTWLQPWGFNNTYAVTMRADRAAELGARKVSDLKDRAGSLTFGATQEFATRPDGLPGLQDTYGMKFNEVRAMDPGLMYQAVGSRQVDVISAFATDGRIPALNLLTLEDDLKFFPPYFAAPVVRQDLLEKDPTIADLLNKLGGKIDDKAMAALNLQVDQDKKEPDEVAKAYLKEQGLIR